VSFNQESQVLDARDWPPQYVRMSKNDVTDCVADLPSGSYGGQERAPAQNDRPVACRSAPATAVPGRCVRVVVCDQLCHWRSQAVADHVRRCSDAGQDRCRFGGRIGIVIWCMSNRCMYLLPNPGRSYRMTLTLSPSASTRSFHIRTVEVAVNEQQCG
jgi:hypothetical protein